MDNKGISAGLAVLFAVAAGLAVGNLYWAQPLLSEASQKSLRQWAFLRSAAQTALQA